MSDVASADESATATTQTQATTTDATQVQNGKDKTAETTQTQVKDWREGIADEKVKELASRYSSPADLAKAQLELRQKLSTAIVPPGKDAKPEDVAAYRQKIGVPEKPDDYKFHTPENHQPTEPEIVARKEWAKDFHDLNIPAEVAFKLTEKMNQRIAAAQAAVVESDKKYAEATMNALKQKWGDDFKTNVELSNRAAKAYFGDNLQAARMLETKDGHFLLDHPLIMEAFAQLGRDMGEDGVKGTLSETEVSSLNAELQKVEEDFYRAYHNGDRQKAAELDKRRSALHARKDGTGPIVGSQSRVV